MFCLLWVADAVGGKIRSEDELLFYFYVSKYFLEKVLGKPCQDRVLMASVIHLRHREGYCRDAASLFSIWTALTTWGVDLSLCPSKRRQPRSFCAINLERKSTGFGVVKSIDWICEKQTFTTHIFHH